MWKDFVKDYFVFTRKERMGIITIVFIIFFIMLISYAFPYFIKPKAYSHKQFETEISLLNVEANDSSKINYYSKNYANRSYNDHAFPGKNSGQIKGEVFYFDPNTISPADWKRLGIRDKTIATIHNYLSKGGKFKKPLDITKIWGMSPQDQQRLLPYVSIAAAGPRPVFPAAKEFPKSSPYPLKKDVLLDINLADTTAYISLPGIGSKLSQRIIAFRDKLGGFYAVTQVGETYLLPDSTFQKIKARLFLGVTPVKQININTATVEEMKVHPYLRYVLANAIFQYRQQHGNFDSVAGIKKIMLVGADAFNKVAPYLSVR